MIICNIRMLPTFKQLNHIKVVEIVKINTNLTRR